jgi:hypothetical protein
VGAPGGQVARKADIAPVWSFREESLAQRKLDDAKALAEYQARLASQPMQYVGPIDDAANARAAMAQQRTANNLAAALGGPFVAAPMLTARAAGLDEHQVEQAGMLGLAALDAAGVKGGVSVTRLGSRPRGLGGLTPAEQAGQLAKAGDMPEGAALFRNKFPTDAIGLQKIVSGVRIRGQVLPFASSRGLSSDQCHLAADQGRTDTAAPPQPRRPPTKQEPEAQPE